MKEEKFAIQNENHRLETYLFFMKTHAHVISEKIFVSVDAIFIAGICRRRKCRYGKSWAASAAVE